MFVSAVWIKEIASLGQQVLPGGTADTLCAPTREGCSTACEMSPGHASKLPERIESGTCFHKQVLRFMCPDEVTS